MERSLRKLPHTDLCQPDFAGRVRTVATTVATKCNIRTTLVRDPRHGHAWRHPGFCQNFTGQERRAAPAHHLPPVGEDGIPLLAAKSPKMKRFVPHSFVTLRTNNPAIPAAQTGSAHSGYLAGSPKKNP